MKKIVILGNSIAGIKAAEVIGYHLSDIEITMLSFEPEYPYCTNLFCDFIQKKKTLKEILYKPVEFYKDKKINVVMDKVFNRVNFNKKKIFTEDKQQFDYDTLIITDSPKHKFPDIKGVNKEGVFGFKRLQDINTAITLLSVNESVAVEAQGFLGLQMALAFSRYKKEILLVIPSGSFLSALLSSSYQEWLLKILQDHGITTIINNKIFEVLGDTDVKAVRLESGKIYASQLVLFDTTTFDLRAYEDERLKMGFQIEVNECFESSIPNVFVLGEISNRSVFSLEEQGAFLGAYLTGKKENAIKNKIAEDYITTDYGSMILLGNLDAPGDLISREELIQEKNSYKKIFFKEDVLVGAFLVNADEEKNTYLHTIGEKITASCP